MKDAEILHLRRVAWERWMQKFCTTLFSAKFTTVSTTNKWCKNSAQPYFPLNWLLYLQQMNDAEILHLIQVAWERWMQNFCTTLFSAKFTTVSTTNKWCKNSARPYFPLNWLLYLQQMYHAEILHLNLTA